VLISFDPREPPTPVERFPQNINGFLVWSAGVMTNRSPTDAVGAMLQIGVDSDNDGRLGFVARRRHWRTHHIAYDLDAGVFEVNHEQSFLPFAPHAVYGITAGGALNLADYVAVTGHVDAAYGRHLQTVLVLGGRLGSAAAVVGTAALVS